MKKPIVSVHAVSNTPEAAAGSILKRFSIIGIVEPKTPAKVKFIRIEAPNTILNSISSNNT